MKSRNLNLKHKKRIFWKKRKNVQFYNRIYSYLASKIHRKQKYHFKSFWKKEDVQNMYSNVEWLSNRILAKKAEFDKITESMYEGYDLDEYTRIEPNMPERGYYTPFRGFLSSILRTKNFYLTTRVSIDEKISRFETFKKYYFLRYRGSLLRKRSRRKNFKMFRASFNSNLEFNFKILACTIVTKEFFSSQKFLKVMPHIYMHNINKFINNFY